MRELGVVIAQVPAVLRPQIQEAASVPQIVAGRKQLCARRKQAACSKGKHCSNSTFPWQQLCGYLANRNQ